MFLAEDAVSAVNEVAAESRASGQIRISEKQQDGGVRMSLHYGELPMALGCPGSSLLSPQQPAPPLAPTPTPVWLCPSLGVLLVRRRPSLSEVALPRGACISSGMKEGGDEGTSVLAPSVGQKGKNKDLWIEVSCRSPGDRGRIPGQRSAHGPETLFMAKPQAPGEAAAFTPAPLLP
ncbi:hypothetical protein MJT46_011451 [Ovis ammon polii x Ovis aries]|nr:hypothetical protein MJT46_011451 [Ovis ammon polii x Ovis aries]